MHVVLAPHLDDEVIGCYSVLPVVDLVVYFTDDYRTASVSGNARYRSSQGIPSLSPEDTVYLPSRYDYHPLHRKVRRLGLSLPGQKMFYSVEMNTPWLEEEEDPTGKRMLFRKMYPGEVETIEKSDRYFLFKSIKPFDDLIWASVKFERAMSHCWPGAPDETAFLRHPHRHKFYFQADVQQFGDDRDLEYFCLLDKIQEWFDRQQWSLHTSCEMFALGTKRWLEHEYPDRMVRVGVWEDGENGTFVE